MAVFFTGALVLFRINLFGTVLINNAMTESADVSGDRFRTAIQIYSSLRGDNPCDLTITVANIGTTRISDFHLMDIVVQATSTVPVSLTFSPEPLEVGEWRVEEISEDFEPGILNPGETLTIASKLNLVAEGPGVLTVGAPNGITDTRIFPSSGTSTAPCAS